MHSLYNVVRVLLFFFFLFFSSAFAVNANVSVLLPFFHFCVPFMWENSTFAVAKIMETVVGRKEKPNEFQFQQSQEHFQIFILAIVEGKNTWKAKETELKNKFSPLFGWNSSVTTSREQSKRENERKKNNKEFHLIRKSKFRIIRNDRNEKKPKRISPQKNKIQKWKKMHTFDSHSNLSIEVHHWCDWKVTSFYGFGRFFFFLVTCTKEWKWNFPFFLVGKTLVRVFQLDELFSHQNLRNLKIKIGYFYCYVWRFVSCFYFYIFPSSSSASRLVF